MKQTQDNQKVVLVDDHMLFRKGMLELINGFKGYEVIWEADNGKELTRKLRDASVPDIVMLDISMPLMDGFDTARWLLEHHPEIKILVLTMSFDEETVIRMLKCGVDGYLHKNAAPSELRAALRALSRKGTYFAKGVHDVLIRGIARKSTPTARLTEMETEFLKLVCSELPYKSMVPILKVKRRTIETIRDRLFRKLQVKTRTGLVVYAIRNGIFRVG